MLTRWYMKPSHKLLIIILCILGLGACRTHSDRLRAQAQTSYLQGYYDQALAPLSKLAREDNAEAQYALGYMYFYGLGTKKNDYLARRLIQHSADLGYPPAQQAIALILHENVGASSNGYAEKPKVIKQKIRSHRHDPSLMNRVSNSIDPSMPHEPLQMTDIEWMRLQDPNYYTIVLAVSNDRNYLQGIRRITTPYVARVTEFRFRQDHEIWYGLVFGSYNDYQSAEHMLMTLHPKIQQKARIKSWVTIQSVMLP